MWGNYIPDAHPQAQIREQDSQAVQRNEARSTALPGLRQKHHPDANQGRPGSIERNLMSQACGDIKGNACHQEQDSCHSLTLSSGHA
jgi:hypothetical protein